MGHGGSSSWSANSTKSSGQSRSLRSGWGPIVHTPDGRWSGGGRLRPRSRPRRGRTGASMGHRGGGPPACHRDRPTRCTPRGARRAAGSCCRRSATRLPWAWLPRSCPRLTPRPDSEPCGDSMICGASRAARRRDVSPTARCVDRIREVRWCCTASRRRTRRLWTAIPVALGADGANAGAERGLCLERVCARTPGVSAWQGGLSPLQTIAASISAQ
jgi:hypothetical protein